jgi:chromosome segregation ATPase
MTDMNLGEALSFARTLGAKVQWLGEIEKMLLAAASAEQAAQEALKRRDEAEAEKAKAISATHTQISEREEALAQVNRRIEAATAKHSETVRRLEGDVSARLQAEDTRRQQAEAEWRAMVAKASEAEAEAAKQIKALEDKIAALSSAYDDLRGRVKSLI